MILNRDKRRIYIVKFWTRAPVHFQAVFGKLWPNNRLEPPFGLAHPPGNPGSPADWDGASLTSSICNNYWRIQDFPDGKPEKPGGGSNLLLVQYSPKTAWNWKKIGPKGEGKGTSHMPPKSSSDNSVFILDWHLNWLICFTMVYFLTSANTFSLGLFPCRSLINLISPESLYFPLSHERTLIHCHSPCFLPDHAFFGKNFAKWCVI